MSSLCGSASSPLSGIELELVAAGPLARSSARAKSKSYLAPQSGRPEGGASGRRQANTASQQDCGRAGGVVGGRGVRGRRYEPERAPRCTRCCFDCIDSGLQGLTKRERRPPLR